jgi:hypothetical protein
MELTPGMNPKLRVGLLLDSETLSAWAYEMLQEIRDSDYASISLVVLNASGQLEQQTSGWTERLRNTWRNRRYLLHTMYDRIDRIRARHLTPDAFALVDARDLLTEVPTIIVTPHQTKFSDRLAPEDIAQIRGYNVDVFLRLGFRILRGEILQVAPFGVWSFHHGDHEINRGGPPGFWEVFERHPVSGAMLQVLTEDLDNGIVLTRSYSTTHPFSVRHNRNAVYWKSLRFVPRKLQELHRFGADQFWARADKPEDGVKMYSRRLYTRPTNTEFIRPLVGHVIHYSAARLRGFLYRDQWILLYSFRDELASSLWRFKHLVPPKDRFWADPQVVCVDGTYQVFIEEFPYAEGKGHISVFQLREDGTVTPPVRVLEAPYHLSYPHVFEWEGAWYMVPECGAERRVDVYRCEEFPTRWVHHTTLMEGRGIVDATLFPHGGKWWMFANMREHAGASPWDELFLFSAEHPLATEWTPHPRNPVVSDVRSSRPAGRLFERHGVIYRPSQNSSHAYGYGLKINRVLSLDDTSYEEREEASVEPKWHTRITGIHSLSQAGRLTMVDAKLRRRRFG